MIISNLSLFKFSLRQRTTVCNIYLSRSGSSFSSFFFFQYEHENLVQCRVHNDGERIFSG